ncbi:transporter substrate-binding domain-containing protein [Actinoplanes subglobosus]|uniref:Transporter substrate-binding domain-containing protein n=1 Tax=Actinoplanes subglobosus TaxID=1547892 RepID=A0ABV8IPD1_9ACTN
MADTDNGGDETAPQQPPPQPPRAQPDDSWLLRTLQQLPPKQLAAMRRFVTAAAPPEPPSVPVEELTVEEIASRDIAAQAAMEKARAEAEHAAITRRDNQFKVWRLAGLGLLIVLTLTVALVRLLIGGPESVAELRAKSGVDSWTTLAIGVKDDQYGTAFYDQATKTWSGFDIDIAYMIAADLGFRRDDVRFYGLESEDRARMQATDPADGKRVPVQLVIASYSITEERKKAGVHFSEPYLYTEQSVITLKGHRSVVALKDLEGQRVCTLSTSTSESALSKAMAIVTQKNRVGECFEALDRNEVEAVSTDAAILAGWQHKFPQKYEHWDLGLEANERWGVNVGENPALEKLVNLTLYRSYADPEDDRWEKAYEQNLQTQIDPVKDTPIAVGQQPPAQRPDISWLPWEDPLG